LVLPFEILRAVLADDLDAGVGERRQVLERHVLGRGDGGDLSANLFPEVAIALCDLGGVDDRHSSISPRAAASSDSRPSSSPFSLRRRSSASTSPTRGDSGRPSAARSSPPISSRTSRSRSK